MLPLQVKAFYAKESPLISDCPSVGDFIKHLFLSNYHLLQKNIWFNFRSPCPSIVYGTQTNQVVHREGVGQSIDSFGELLIY